MRLGRQQQEEMKSLIQNSLKLGEQPQTTETIGFTSRKGIKTTTVFDAFRHCFFLSTSYMIRVKISIKNLY